jgi:O-antigen/teichoic acid export membrane protein
MSDKKQIIANSAKYTPSNLFVRIMQLIQGVFVANLLGPIAYGLKNALQMFLDYGNYGHFGVLFLFTKERQKTEFKNIKKRDYITNLSYSFLMFVGALFAILGVILFFVLNYSLSIRLSLLFIGFLVPVSFFAAFCYNILQSKSDFKIRSIANIIQGIFLVIFVVVAVYFIGVPGYFLGLLLAWGLVDLYLIYQMKMTYKFIFNIKLFFGLIVRSFPLFLLSLNYLLFVSIDRIVIWFNFGALEMGYYAIGMFFSGLMYFFISTLLVPVIPIIYQTIDKKVKQIRYVITSYRISMYLIYYVVLIIIFLYPIIVFLMPEYRPGTAYVNILIFSTMLFPILSYNYFIAKNKEKLMLALTGLFLCLALVLDLLVVYLGLKVVYIAYSTLISFFLYGTITNLICYKQLLGSYSKALKETFNYLWPLGYALVGYGLLWILAHQWLYGILNYYVVKVIQAILFTIWYSPILWKVEKEHKILKTVCGYIKGKISPKAVLLENTTIE